MIKRITLFLFIIGIGLIIYFFQSGLPESLPAVTQPSLAINSQNNTDQEILKKETSLSAPLKVETQLLSADINSINLTINGVMNFTNTERIKQSLPILSLSEKLNKSAAIKVEDMFKYQYFEHTSPNGVSIEDLATQVEYEYILIGENLAQGDFKDDQALVDAWMNSPKHRANILNDHFTEIGIAVGQGLIAGQRVWLAVQHFGRPLDLCTGIDLALKATIEVNKSRLDALASELDLDAGGVSQAISYITDFSKVQEYNDLVKEVAAQIDLYNQQVAAFNTCISN